MNRAQVAYAALGFLVVCSMVAASVGVLATDVLFQGDDDPQEFDLNADNDDLIDEYRADLEENPNDAPKMALLAELLYYDGEVDESIAWYQRALELEPDNTAIRLSFATILAEADKPNDAELQFQKVLEVEPNSFEAHYYLAELYRFWDPPRHDEAADHYLRVIEIAPTSYLAQVSGEQLVALGYATPAPSGSPAASPAAA
jgi:cytochrome c-type biogenesis protein CcmH/NrfG